MFKRALILPPAATETFFLWGPRQTGKSTLLRETYRGAHWVDLLKSEHFRTYTQRPESLRHALAARPDVKQVVIDEVQRVPELLNEVHWLMENRGVCFALCGSSARKVRGGGANLLGGRAIRLELFGLTSAELAEAFDLDRLLNHGYLPRVHESSRPGRLLKAYVGDYLKEEIAAEGLVRRLPAFADFLDMAALGDGLQVSYSTLARDCGVSVNTVKSYFGILVDTLLARWVPSFRRRPKRRVSAAPKVYFSDVGVVSRLARRGVLHRGSEAYGRAFENWIFHELSAYLSYSDADARISYWRLVTGAEVDFVVGDMELAVEAKGSERVRSHHLKGLRQLKIDHPEVQRRIIVSLDPSLLTTDDGIEQMPYDHFARALWSGALLGR
jgi:uncharacterized protein